MSEALSDFLAHFPAPALIAIALGLFIFAFGSASWLALRSANRPVLDAMARLPLEEDHHG
jgi:hypothetical protein